MEPHRGATHPLSRVDKLEIAWQTLAAAGPSSPPPDCAALTAARASLSRDRPGRPYRPQLDTHRAAGREIP